MLVLSSKYSYEAYITYIKHLITIIFVHLNHIKNVHTCIHIFVRTHERINQLYGHRLKYLESNYGKSVSVCPFNKYCYIPFYLYNLVLL